MFIYFCFLISYFFLFRGCHSHWSLWRDIWWRKCRGYISDYFIFCLNICIVFIHLGFNFFWTAARTRGLVLDVVLSEDCSSFGGWRRRSDFIPKIHKLRFLCSYLNSVRSRAAFLLIVIFLGVIVVVQHHCYQFISRPRFLASNTFQSGVYYFGTI